MTMAPTEGCEKAHEVMRSTYAGLPLATILYAAEHFCRPLRCMKRRISRQTHKLLSELRDRSGTFAWTRTRTSSVVRLIQEVGSVGEPAAIFHLFPFALSRNAEISRAAIEVA